jgi:hypothetical protein
MRRRRSVCRRNAGATKTRRGRGGDPPVNPQRGLQRSAERHTFACLHIAAGCNPKWLQQQLGHSSIQITLDVYGDHFELKDRQAADALGSTLLGNQTGSGGRL